MPRLLAVTDRPALHGALTSLPAAWKIVVVPGGSDIAVRVGRETSAAVLDMAADRLDAAVGDVERLLPGVPLLIVTPEETYAGVHATLEPTPDPRALHLALLRLLNPVPPTPARLPEPDAPTPGVHTGAPRTDVADAGRRAAPAGGALLKRLRERMVDGLSRAGGAFTAGSTRTTNAVPTRIDDALSALDRVRDLIDEMPALATFDEVANALIEELVEELGAQTAVLWTDCDGEYGISVGHGLTPAEARMRVAPDHPVLADLTTNVNSVLLSPLDEARALVAGLAGARGESFMAAVLETDGSRAGFVTMASDLEYGPTDLATLEKTALEAARGLVLAQILEELGPAAAQRVLAGAGEGDE